jgi:hypothetical protein
MYIFQCLTQTLSKTTSFTKPEGVKEKRKKIEKKVRIVPGTAARRETKLLLRGHIVTVRGSKQCRPCTGATGAVAQGLQIEGAPNFFSLSICFSI